MYTKDILDVVQELNSTLFENNDENTVRLFEVRTRGTLEESVVMFLGEVLWSSENDERVYIDESDDYEPLIDFIKRESNKVIDRLQTQKIK